MKPYLILYDITENKYRNKIAKEIISRGLYRIQKSVFLGATFTEKIRELENIFTIHIQSTQSINDKLMIIPLDQYNLREMEIFLPDDEKFDLDFYLGQKVVIFI